MKSLRIFFLIIALACTMPEVSTAQCAMCRRVAESSADANDNKAGKGLNKGILYLLAIPYVLAGTGAYFWYKNRKK